MKLLFLTTLLCALPGGELPDGDRERGLKLYQEGRYEEAAAAFRLAIASEGDSAELQYNLALASWRAGDLATAETAVEKYAALADTARVDLHAGVLGGVRYEEAKRLEDAADEAVNAQEDPLPILKQALTKAEQARDHFVRGASETPSRELLRNTERALHYVEDLKKKIEEIEKQREEQEDHENEDNKQDDENKDDQEKKSEEKKDDKGEGEKGEQEQGEQKPDEPEPKEGAQDPAEPRPNEQQEGGQESPQDQKEQQPEPQQRNDAPGEAAEGRELSPEQTQRLLEQLRDLEGKLKALRAQAKTRRKPVERDW